jgi:LAS superfamily LD-carboxypeptidase LdcB
VADSRGLQPLFRPAAEALLAEMRRAAPGFVITSGFRTKADQERLFARFQAGLSGVYTVLPPGKSQHERGWAVDIARVGVDPKADALLAAFGARWRAAGGVWGGAADPVHFEAPKRWTGRT